MQNPEIGNPPKANHVAKMPWPNFLAWAGVVFCLATSPIHAETADTGEIAPRTPEVETTDEREGWQFEVGAGFLLHSQGQTASVDAEWADPDDPLNVSGGRVEPALAPGFTLEATVLTPGLTSHKYAPRLYARVGYEALLEDSFATYRAFDSSALSGQGICSPLPTLTVEIGGNPETGIAIPGLTSCDSKTDIDTSIQDMWFLGVGVEVPLPIFEDRMKVRLGLDYLGQRWGASEFSWSRSQTWGVCTSRNYPTAFLNNVIGVPVLGNNNSCNLQTNPPTIPIQDGNRTQATTKNEVSSSFSSATTHALGFDVSTLVDVYKWKEFQLRLYLDTRFAWILSDSGGDIVIPSEYGTFEVSTRPDQFIAQAGGGIRIYWTPHW